MNHSNARRRFVGTMGKLAVAGASVPAWAAQALAASPLNVGYQDTSWGAVMMIGLQQKLFAKAGCSLQPRLFDSGNSTRNAMISGGVDVGVLGVTPFILGVDKAQMHSLAVAMYAGATNAVVARKGTGIQSIADLKGKVVASQVGSATDYVFQNVILPHYGVNKSEVRIINVTFQNQVAALLSKSADAFAGVEPYPSVAIVDGIGHEVVDYEKFDMQPVFVAVDPKPYADDKPELVKFMRGWLEASAMIRHDPQEASRIIWDRFKAQGYSFKQAIIQRMLSKLDLDPSYRPTLDAYLTRQAGILVHERKIQTVPDWKSALDTSILAQARKA